MSYFSQLKFLSERTVGSLEILVSRRSAHCSLTFLRVTLTGSSLHAQKAISDFPVAKLKPFGYTFQCHWNCAIWMPILGAMPISLGEGRICIAVVPCFG